MIAIAAIFRNEAPYLKEWIEFHLKVGFERFFLFNNLSTDDFQSVLKPYKDLIELTHWPLEHSNIVEWNEIQCLAYERAIHKAQKYKWLALLDIDEFLFSPVSKTLPPILDRFEHAGGIGVNWQLFGTSCVPQIDPNQRLIEALTYRFPKDLGVNHHVKPIVRPDRVLICESPHFAIYKEPFRQLTTNGIPFEGPISPTICTELLRINHYVLRDLNYFSNQKTARLSKWWGQSIDWQEKYREKNQEEDRTILQL